MCLSSRLLRHILRRHQCVERLPLRCTARLTRVLKPGPLQAWKIWTWFRWWDWVSFSMWMGLLIVAVVFFAWRIKVKCDGSRAKSPSVRLQSPVLCARPHASSASKGSASRYYHPVTTQTGMSPRRAGDSLRMVQRLPLWYVTGSMDCLLLGITPAPGYFSLVSRCD